MTMTADYTAPVIYEGDDATTEFSITFKFWNDADIRVTLIDVDDVETVLTLGTHYTLTGGAGATGQVTYPVSGDELATDERIAIESILVNDQLNDATSRGDNFYIAMETTFDKTMRKIQQNLAKIDRAALASIGYEGDIPSIDELLALSTTIIGEAKGAIFIHLNDGGGVLANGVRNLFIEMPFNGTFTSARLFADASSTVTVDIWKDTYANFPPLVADTIINTGGGGVKPLLSSTQKYEDTGLIGFTKTFVDGDIFEISLADAAVLTTLSISLRFNKTG